MDIMSAIMILVPLLAPMAVLCGIHPIHLGIVFIVNLELGYLTPPMGLNLFVSSSIFNKPLGEVIKSVIPFTGIMLVSVLIVTYVPTISLGPVNVLNGKDFFVSFPDQAACSPSVTNDDDDDDDDDISIGNETEKGLPAAKSIGELMKSKAFKDALDDDDDKSVGTKTPTGAQSIGDLMKSKAYQNALDDDDDDDEDDDDDDDKTFDGKGPKSIGDLMKSKAYQKALRRDTPKTPPSAP
jgi:C4-dicarboxylate transporter DctM subunit